MQYLAILIVIFFLLIRWFVRSISPSCSPISNKDIGKKFKRVTDKDFGDVLQEYDEEVHMVHVPKQILETIPKGKAVELVTIENNMPIFA